MSEVFGKLFEVTPLAWSVLATVLVLSIIGLVFLSKKEPSDQSANTKKLVYGGICISIAFVLSYIRIFSLPQGGSITPASMLPLVLYAMMFGPVAGIVAGVAYGFLQLIQDMWAVNIAQLLLDYPLAFGCIGLAGIAPKRIKNIYLRTGLAITLGVYGRCVMHIISGALFFAEYAPKGMNPFIYSLSYNGAFLSVELIITLIISLAIISTPVYSILKKSACTAYNG